MGVYFTLIIWVYDQDKNLENKAEILPEEILAKNYLNWREDI